MKLFRILIPLMVGLVVIFGAVWIVKSKVTSSSTALDQIYYCPMHPTYTAKKPGECPICHMSLVKREADKTDEEALHEHAGHTPEAGSKKEYTVEEIMKMKPGEICLLHKCKMGNCMFVMTEEAARMGKCPHCGEDLGVIVKDALPAGYGTVKLSPEKQQLIGVKTEAAKKIQLEKTIRAVGTVAQDPELYQAEAEYIQALAALKKAEQGGIENVIQQAKRLVDSTQLRLKSMGLSEELITEIGNQTEPDRNLLFPNPGAPSWIYAQVYEYELPLIKAGQNMIVQVPSITGVTFNGKVRSVDPIIDPATRTARVRAQMENSEGLLRADMYVNVEIKVNIGEVLAVHKEAVFDTGTKQIVFVQSADGSFEPRTVALGAKGEEYYEIKNGLAEGENVVISGNFLIDSESRLSAAIKEAVQGGHQHGA